jgi:hypothetical protein
MIKQLETLEDWVSRAFADSDPLPFRDVHFDMLDDPVRTVQPGRELLKASCDVIDRVQKIAAGLNTGPEPWRLFVCHKIEWDTNQFPTWRESFWDNLGRHIEPPSIILVKNDLACPHVAERYSLHLSLPFEGYTHLDAIYMLERTREEILNGEEYCPRLDLLHRERLMPN